MTDLILSNDANYPRPVRPTKKANKTTNQVQVRLISNNHALLRATGNLIKVILKLNSYTIADDGGYKPGRDGQSWIRYLQFTKKEKK